MAGGGRVNPEVFHAKVYEICRLIPHGRVTTYGHIAKLTGHPTHSRLVGAALKFLGDPTVPWQRVIASSGAISDRGDGGEAATRQAQRLREEGVTVSEGRGGGVSVNAHPVNGNPKWRVSLSEYGWFPDYVHLEGFDHEPEVIRDDADDDSDLTSLSGSEGQ